MNATIPTKYKNNFIIWGAIICFILSSHQLLISQNPSQMDVESNLNLSGQLLLNNQPGTPGQFPLSNGDGTMSWGGPSSISNFDYNRSISYTQSGAWIVPAGVTEIMFEVWGAGGAGNFSGGGSGAYLLNVISVTPGSAIPITIGAGGVPGGNVDGGHSQLSHGGVPYRAEGGKSATFSRSNSSFMIETAPGKGGGASNGLRAFGYSVSGHDGSRGGLSSTTNFTGGFGGTAPFTTNTGGSGGRYYRFPTSHEVLVNSTAGSVPGGGGGVSDAIGGNSVEDSPGGNGL